MSTTTHWPSFFSSESSPSSSSLDSSAWSRLLVWLSTVLQSFLKLPRTTKIITALWLFCAGVSILALSVTLSALQNQNSQGAAQSSPIDQGITWCNLASSTESSQDKTTQVVSVYVSGGVQKPGVYELPDDGRVIDAVEAAGGFSKQADGYKVARSINGAEKLSDADHIYIPVYQDRLIDQNTSLAGNSTTASSKNDESKSSISINTATAKQLTELSGIGESRAEAIISGRPYSSIDELNLNKIIPKSTIEEIKEKISL